MFTVLNWIAFLLASATAVSLLLSRDWRWSLGILAVQYLGMFWLVHAHWPITMATAKLIIGWMACAALGMTQIGASVSTEAEGSWPEGRLFHSFAAGLVIVVTFPLAVRVVNWLGISLPVAWGGLILIGLGLLHLGITARPLRVIVGLLTVLAGFEVLYAAIEGSVLVAALLAIINLGLALTGAYLLTANAVEEAE